VRMHQHTNLSVEEQAVALAIFAKLHGHKHGSVQAHLDTTQRDAYGEARAWVDSNAKLVGSLRSYPERLADGVFAVEPVRGLLARVFSRSHDETLEPQGDWASSRAAKTKPAKGRSEDEQRRLAEAKALVEEALREG